MKTSVLTHFRRLLAVLFLLPSSSFAATLYVGSCHSPSYPTISAAVLAATPGSVVDVCPGTYPEQVFVLQPLTLQGIRAGNSDRARITVPTVIGGPPNWQFVPDPDGGAAMVAPQIYVNSPAGMVTIKNLTIDASADTTSPACLAAGYFHTTAIFLQNSSGTISGVSTLGQGKNAGCGVGIRAWVPPAPPATLTLSNSYLQDAHQSGLVLEGAGLTVDINKNVLDLTSNNYGIFNDSVSGTISSNLVSALGDLIADYGSSGSVTFTDNILKGNSSCSAAFLLIRDAQLTGNKIEGCGAGIDFLSFSTNTVSLKNNLVAGSNVGMDLGCDPNITLTGNTVNGAFEGVDNPAKTLPLTGVTVDNADALKIGTCP